MEGMSIVMEDSPDFLKIRIPDPVLLLGLKVRTFPDPNFCDKLTTIAILKSVPKKFGHFFLLHTSIFIAPGAILQKQRSKQFVSRIKMRYCASL